MPLYPIAWTLSWIAGLYPVLFGEEPWELIAIPAAAGLMNFLLWRFRRMSMRQSACAVLLVALSLPYHTWFLSASESRIAAGEGQLAAVRGMIVSRVEVDGDRAAFAVRAEQVDVLGQSVQIGVSGGSGTSGAQPSPAWRGGSERLRAVIRLQSEEEQRRARGWEQGMSISLAGELVRPQEAGNWGAFDYREYLRRQRIHWMVETKGLDGVTAGHEGKVGTSVEAGDRSAMDRPLHQRLYGNVYRAMHRSLAAVNRIREDLAGRIDALYGETYGGLMRSMVIGHREFFDEEQNRKFSHVGLAHILAVSGMHVGIFCGIILFALRAFGVVREKALIICMLLIPAYVLLTGAAPPVVRAGLMAAIGMELARRNRLRSGIHLLCFAAWAMLAWNPYLLADIGFQLSFLITAGLIVGVRKVAQLLPLRSKILNSTVSVALVAQCTAFPLTIFHFNSFSLLSFPANLVLAPLISVVAIPLGMFALAVSYVHMPTARFAAQVGNEINEAVFAAIDRMLRIDPWGAVFPSPPVWWIAVYYALLAIILQSLTARIRYIGLPLTTRQSERRRAAWTGLACSSAALLILLLAYAYDPGRWDARAAVSFLDVGQGDAILIKTPQNRHILIDSGGTMRWIKQGEEWRMRRDPYEIGRDLLVPLLKRRGVRELELLVLTHADHDHIGGALAVIERLPVRGIVFNGTLRNHDSAKAVFQAAVDRGIPLYAAERGKRIRLEPDAQIVFLHPASAVDSGQAEQSRNVPAKQQSRISLAKEQNPVSTVMLVELYGTTFLFTGDIDQKAEQDILQALRGNLQAMQGNRQELLTAGDGLANGDLILKVAHHGSKSSTSQEWLEYWRPAHAVISVGKNNPYRHPHPAVIGRLADIGAAIHRTDLHGEVRFVIGPDGYRTETKKGGRAAVRTD
jgi:competence protein ComEC